MTRKISSFIFIGLIFTLAVWMSDKNFTVCMPPQGVSTPRAYARFDEMGTDVKVDGEAAAAALYAGDLDALCAQMVNELQFSSESTANEPICAALRAAGAKAALMTGSGAAVYGVFETRAQAEAAKTALLRTWPKVWAVHPVRCGAHVCRGR